MRQNCGTNIYANVVQANGANLRRLCFVVLFGAPSEEPPTPTYPQILPDHEEGSGNTHLMVTRPARAAGTPRYLRESRHSRDKTRGVPPTRVLASRLASDAGPTVQGWRGALQASRSTLSQRNGRKNHE